MLSMGIIRKLKSPYAAPPVLVKKPDGSVRFCVNYKKMNSVTVFDGEPMPSPDDRYIKMKVMRNEPVLKIISIINFDQTMYLQTDASDVGLGGALLQKHGNTYHPVRFISRKLKSAERNYSTIEKEGLAIVWAIEKLMVYLYGREFVLLTDHRLLTFITLSKMHNSRVIR